eukprot:1326062-Amorphochlora_amoeboformis.AAC.2
MDPTRPDRPAWFCLLPSVPRLKYPDVLALLHPGTMERGDHQGVVRGRKSDGLARFSTRAEVWIWRGWGAKISVFAVCGDDETDGVCQAVDTDEGISQHLPMSPPRPPARLP